ncbi:MAG: hypothetical protein NT140_06085 [Deltaproteobacteria bacterium]|nr:hypothetical protein [Deltaproteobacteria bacterium]
MKDIIIETGTTLISLLRVLINHRINYSFPVFQKDNFEINILCTGPSLNESLSSSGNIFQSKDSMCVNKFAESDFFEIIKPSYYLLLDPVFWEENSRPVFIAERDRLYKLINTKTNWHLNLLLPLSAKHAFNWNYIFQNNSNIRISFFNNVPLTGFKSIIHSLYKHNQGMPPAQNVLVAAIFVAINMGYKKLYLLGADHSWHERLVLNDENVVCYRESNFFDKTEQQLIPWFKAQENAGTNKMHEIFMEIARMFLGYQYLEEYSKYRNVKIYNASPKTYIDAFERYNFKRN